MLRLTARVVFALVTTAVGASSAALAGVSAEALYGIESATWHYAEGNNIKTKTMTGSELGASLAVSPIPLVPVSIGLLVRSQSFNTSKLNQQVADEVGAKELNITATGKVTGLVYGPELMAWLPLPFVKPYLRAGYTVGHYKETAAYTGGPLAYVSPALGGSASNDAEFKSTGTEFGAGLMFSPLPLLAILVEYHRSQEQHKLSTFTETAAAQKLNTSLSALPPGLQDQSFVSSSIRFGLQVSI